MPEPKRLKTEDEMVRNFKALYEHTNKDMPLPEFIREMKGVMDPNKILNDLSDIELQKARARANKLRIDRACQN